MNGSTASRTLTHVEVRIIGELSNYDHPDHNKERSELPREVQDILQKLRVETLQEAITYCHRRQLI